MDFLTLAVGPVIGVSLGTLIKQAWSGKRGRRLVAEVILAAVFAIVGTVVAYAAVGVLGLLPKG